MSGFVVLLAMAAIGLVVAMFLCKSLEQRISTGVSFAVLVLFCVCCRLFLASDSAGSFPLVVACLLLPPVAYAVVFMMMGRRAQRSTGLGELRSKAPVSRNRPSVSDKKKVHSARHASPTPVPAVASQPSAFAPIVPAAGSEAAQGAQWDSWNAMGEPASAVSSVPSGSSSHQPAVEMGDSKADLESTAELPRAFGSASESEPAPEVVALVEPIPESGLSAASITEPIAVSNPAPEPQLAPKSIVEPISTSSPEPGRGTNGESESGSEAKPEPESDFDSVDASGEIGADESEVRGDRWVASPLALPSVVPPLRLADDEEAEPGRGLTVESEFEPELESTTEPGLAFESDLKSEPEPAPEYESAPEPESEPEPAPEHEPAPEREPAPEPEPEPAPEPGESPFDAEKFFSKAASLRDRGLFLVAAPIYAECALQSEDPAVVRRASFEELACYVKGGRIDVARDLALELRSSSEDLSPVETMKLDAVMGMEA